MHHLFLSFWAISWQQYFLVLKFNKSNWRTCHDPSANTVRGLLLCAHFLRPGSSAVPSLHWPLSQMPVLYSNSRSWAAWVHFQLHYSGFWFTLLVQYMLFATKNYLWQKKSIYKWITCLFRYLQSFSWFLRIKPTCEHKSLPRCTRGFQILCDSAPLQTLYCSDLFLLKKHALLLLPMCSSFKEHYRGLSFFYFFYDDFHFDMPHCRNNWILWAQLNRMPVVIIAPMARYPEELMPSVVSPWRSHAGLQKVTDTAPLSHIGGPSL